MKPELVRSTTYHKRKGGLTNAFRYSVDYVLSEPEARTVLPWLLSRNARNLASINDVDHGGARGAGTGASWVREVLAAHNVPMPSDGRILLLAQPKIAGYLFNPVSFWIIVNQQDLPIAFIAEVNNTMGDRHSYLCHHPDFRPIMPQDQLTAEKVFHVSPFQKIAGHYRFNLEYSARDISIRIDFSNGKEGLLATLVGTRVPLTSATLLASVIRRPLGSLRVVALIHWQAVRLLVKKAPFTKRPLPPSSEVSQ